MSTINIAGVYDKDIYITNLDSSRFIDKKLSYRIIDNATIKFYENTTTSYMQYTLYDNASNLISGATPEILFTHNCVCQESTPPPQN